MWIHSHQFHASEPPDPQRGDDLQVTEARHGARLGLTQLNEPRGEWGALQRGGQLPEEQGRSGLQGSGWGLNSLGVIYPDLHSQEQRHAM